MRAGLLSNDAIIAMVGHEAYARGMAYANNGNVTDVRVDTRQLVVNGQVLGDGRRRYQVRVQLVDADDHTGHRSTCTCPVVRDRKHAAAVLIVARSSLGTAAQATRPEWEQLVTRLVREAPPPNLAPAEIGLELMVDTERSYGEFQSAPRLLMRPVRRGARARWVYSGVSWSDLDYSSDAWSDDARELLLQVRAAAGPAARFSSPRSAWLALDDASTLIWWLLANAGRAGLTLVGDKGSRPVVRTERVAVRLELETAADGGLRGRVGLPAEVLQPGELFEVTRSNPTFGLLGKPAHGAYWLATPATPDGPRDLVLARLARPLPTDLNRLVQQQATIQIPPEDRDRFLIDHLPALRRAIPVVSDDPALVLAAPPPPELLLRVGFRPEHRVRLDWMVRYRSAAGHRAGEPERRFGIDESVAVSNGLRDPLAEQELLAALDLPYGELPQLADPDVPRRPAAHALLGGLHAAQFVHDVLPRLVEQGLVIETDGDVVDYRPASSDPEVTVSTTATESSDWFDLHVVVRIDGEPVPFDQLFVALSTGADSLVLETGVYVSLDDPALDRLRELIDEAQLLQDRDGGGSQLRINRFQTSLWHELTQAAVVMSQADAWQQTVRALAPPAPSAPSADSETSPGEAPVELPVSLRADLRPYQRDGYGWLVSLWRHRLGGILADDMGLGKTVQTLAMIAYAREREPEAPPFLVVAPTSVVTIWASEAAAFVPELKIRTVTRSRRKGGRSLTEELADADIVVTSYALLRIDHERYAGQQWSGLILDEAQFVKNHRSKTYQAARLVPARLKLAITGTPVENGLLDLWSMLSLTAPGLFPSIERFSDYYLRPIEREGSSVRLAQLRRRIGPLVLRRTKDLVAAELPPKQEQVLQVPLQPKHARIYQTHLQRERQKVLGLLDDLDENRFTVLGSLTLLRRLALDPALVDESHAGIAASKTELLLELLTEVVGEGHRALVFSQFTGYLRRVEARLSAAGLRTAYLDGGTVDRQAAIATFRTGAADVFLISLRAGGFGLNLAEADYCFVLDPWWNPAVEQQAVDRAHRLGQTRPVMVYRLVAQGTIEEKVMTLKEHKSAVFDAVLGGDSFSSARFGADEIRSLLGAQPIAAGATSHRSDEF
ncbi:MAG: DEAD/DEAH box helicase [Microlunatus sp.]